MNTQKDSSSNFAAFRNAANKWAAKNRHPSSNQQTRANAYHGFMRQVNKMARETAETHTLVKQMYEMSLAGNKKPEATPGRPARTRPVVPPSPHACRGPKLTNGLYGNLVWTRIPAELIQFEAASQEADKLADVIQAELTEPSVEVSQTAVAVLSARLGRSLRLAPTSIASDLVPSQQQTIKVARAILATGIKLQAARASTGSLPLAIGLTAYDTLSNSDAGNRLAQSIGVSNAVEGARMVGGSLFGFGVSGNNNGAVLRTPISTLHVPVAGRGDRPDLPVHIRPDGGVDVFGLHIKFW